MENLKYTCWLTIVCAIIATGCKKTENFYEQLDNLPRANKLLNNAYAVGDTLSLTGKFGAGKGNLSITVGGIQAPVLSLTTHDSSYVENEVTYNYTADLVKVLITAPMIGLQQTVVVTLNGVSSTVATIVVAKDRPLPARADTLSCLDPAQYREALHLPVTTRVIPNYTPGGAMVFMNGDSIISWQAGMVRRGKVNWRDQYGDFMVLDASNPANYGFATDPAGRNLYVSCLTKDGLLPGDEYAAVRLMKVSLENYSVITLNRTVLPTGGFLIDNTVLDLDTVRREGPVDEVFLPVFRNLYVNSKEELYFSNPSLNYLVADGYVANLLEDNLTIGRIDASGNLQYLAKGHTSDNKIFQVRLLKNGEFIDSYDFLPNLTTVFDYNRLMAIDPENALLYAYTGTSINLFTINTFSCYDIMQKRQLSSFTYKQVSNWAPTITDGPFNVVEGNYYEMTSGTRIFHWLAPGQPMTIFAMQQQYQGTGNYEYVWKGANRSVYYEMRSVKIIHFDSRTVSTYSPVAWPQRNGLPPQVEDPTDPGEIFYSKYRLGPGGDVIGYTAAGLPLMIRTPEIDPQLNEVILMEPLQ